MKEQFRQMFMWDEKNENSGLIYDANFNIDGDVVSFIIDTKYTPNNDRQNAKYLQKLIRQFDLQKYINLNPVYVKYGVGAHYYAFFLSKIGEDLGMGSIKLWMEFGENLRESEHIAKDWEYGDWHEINLEIPLPPIDESVSFERGKDPKRAMEVGMYGTLPKIIGGDYFKEGIRFNMTNDDIDRILNNAFDPSEWEMDYGFHIEWPDGSSDYQFLDQLVSNPHLDYIIANDEIYDVAMKVYEGISFKRGQDPKSAMGLGFLKDIPKKIFQADYDSNYLIGGGIPIDNMKFNFSFSDSWPHLMVKFFRNPLIDLDTGEEYSKILYLQDILVKTGLRDIFNGITYTRESPNLIYCSLKEEYVKPLEDIFGEEGWISSIA